MELSREQKSVIEGVINAFETGSAEGDYGCISVYHDGPHDIPQITYGRSQTTEYGNLRILIERYATSNGVYSAQLGKFADSVGSVALTRNREFRGLLREAGRNDPIMQKMQDEFFDDLYFAPAMKWADNQGFSLALSGLVIYDSFVHSGSVLWLIRQRFPEDPPRLGGDEKAWIEAYLRERHGWLKSHRRAAVRASTYRTRDLSREVSRENWNLSHVPICANGVDVFPRV